MSIINLIIFLIIFNFVFIEVKAGGVYNANIINYYDQSFMINVQIGTPAQNFNVMLSTGNSELWVKNSSLKTTRPRFFSKNSRTFSKSNKFMVLENIEGLVGIDTVQFAGLKLDKIEFSIVDLIYDNTLDQPFDGILGLAYPSLGHTNITSPVMTAIQRNLFANKMFTMYLKGGYGIDAENKDGGLITFGDYDYKNCGKILGWAKITRQEHYQFQIDSISINAQIFSGKTQAILESSTSVIMGDKKVVDNLAIQIGAVWDKNERLYILSCNKNYSTITLTIGRTKLVLTKDIFTFQLSSNKCAFAMVPTPPSLAREGYNWVIGNPVMRAYCHTFDIAQNRIGFSQVLNT